MLHHPLGVLLFAGCNNYQHGGDKDGTIPVDPFVTDDTTDTEWDTDDPTDTDTDTDTTDDTGTATWPLGCLSMAIAAEPVPLNAACNIPAEVGTFSLEVEWELPGSNGYGPPVAGQLDDDNNDGVIDSNDVVDILLMPHDFSGMISVNGQTGAFQWRSFAANVGDSGIAIGDVDGDGVPEIAAADGVNRVVLMDNLGYEIWNTRIDSGPLDMFMVPSIADMDGDGMAEIIAGRTILDWQGNVLGSGNRGVAGVPSQSGPLVEGSIPVAVDLDGDGELEVVTGNAAYRMDGTLKYSNNLPDGCPAVADFDLDGEPEIVTVSGDTIYTMESDLQPTGWSDAIPNTDYLGPPAAGDLDGDGVPEFVVAGAEELRAYTWSGTLLWTAPVEDFSGAAGPILFDFEGDGFAEVVHADEQWIRILNGYDGSVRFESPDHQSTTGFETPIVADVDSDGEAELVVMHATGPVGLSVYGDPAHVWPPGRQVWNQHAYSITNVGDDLTLPAPQLPNWAEYNSFRSGAITPPPPWEDAVAEVVDSCLDDCPGQLVLLVRVRNEGTVEIAPGLPVVVRAGPTGPIVASATVPAAIPGGYASEGMLFDLDTADLGGAEPWVEVDRDTSGDERLSECDEANNLAVAPATCP